MSTCCPWCGRAKGHEKKKMERRDCLGVEVLFIPAMWAVCMVPDNGTEVVVEKDVGGFGGGGNRVFERGQREKKGGVGQLTGVSGHTTKPACSPSRAGWTKARAEGVKRGVCPC